MNWPAETRHGILHSLLVGNSQYTCITQECHYIIDYSSAINDSTDAINNAHVAMVTAREHVVCGEKRQFSARIKDREQRKQHPLK